MKLKSMIDNALKLMSLILFNVQIAHAGGTVFIVDSTADQPQEGLTTLREAIAAANLDPNSRIDFDETVFSSAQTIILENGEIGITSAMHINGPGMDLLSIDANNLSRVFGIRNDDQVIEVDISGITLANGSTEGPGGCINNRERLTLRASVIKNCSAGANGGGIHSFTVGNLLIENSSFLNNFSDNSGGGLFFQNGGGYLIINSTFFGNIASRSGGGLALTQISSIDFINNTVSGNQSQDGAGISSGAPLQISNSTIINNIGTGVRLSQDSIQNSIIAGNTLGDCVFENIGFENLNNFDGDGSCNVSPARGDVVNDPMLGPLRNNGGLTLTHSPLSGSPVIDNADDLLCTEFDQRGLARPIDGDGDEVTRCDIGAVEFSFELDEVIYSDGFDEFICPVQDSLDSDLVRGC